MSAPNVAWAEGIERIHAEAAGLMRLHMIAAADCAELIAGTILADPYAGRLLQAITEAGRQIVQAPRRKPSLCICCPRPVRKLKGVSFGIALPDKDDATNALSFVVCQRCSAAPGDLMPRVIDSLRRLWPDARPVVVTHPEGGRA